MIEHIGIYVDRLAQNNTFYQPLFETLGWGIVFQTPHCIAYGKDIKALFEIYEGKEKSSPFHIALAASSRDNVDHFYRKALTLGAKDNGPPGYREYFPDYYAAFVIDPNGHNLEALFWQPVLSSIK